MHFVYIRVLHCNMVDIAPRHALLEAKNLPDLKDSR